MIRKFSWNSETNRTVHVSCSSISDDCKSTVVVFVLFVCFGFYLRGGGGSFCFVFCSIVDFPFLYFCMWKKAETMGCSPQKFISDWARYGFCWWQAPRVQTPWNPTPRHNCSFTQSISCLNVLKICLNKRQYSPSASITFPLCAFIATGKSCSFPQKKWPTRDEATLPQFCPFLGF